jgi:SAM-dependent methyltransferase
MRRLRRLRAGIDLEHEVLEIGPYHAPIAPKALGYRTVTLDIVAADELRLRAAADPTIGETGARAVEEVDLIGSACDVGDLVRDRFGPDRRFDWILSSHNIEHLPDPIRFLAQCGSVLAPGGILRLAVPDKRGCFDHFRPVSDIGEWLQAFRERRTRPTVYQVFREECYRAEMTAPGGERGRWRLGEVHLHAPTPVERSLELYRAWFAPGSVEPAEYLDTHCWAFTPESFELIVRDVIAFGLVPLEVASVSRTRGNEFFVDLRRPAAAPPLDERRYFAARHHLLRRTVRHDNLGLSLVSPLPLVRGIARRVIGLVQPRRAA